MSIVEGNLRVLHLEEFPKLVQQIFEPSHQQIYNQEASWQSVIKFPHLSLITNHQSQQLTHLV